MQSSLSIPLLIDIRNKAGGCSAVFPAETSVEVTGICEAAGMCDFRYCPTIIEFQLLYGFSNSVLHQILNRCCTKNCFKKPEACAYADVCASGDIFYADGSAIIRINKDKDLLDAVLVPLKCI